MADPKASGSIASHRPDPKQVGDGERDEQHEGVPSPGEASAAAPDDERLRSETAHRPEGGSDPAPPGGTPKGGGGA